MSKATDMKELRAAAGQVRTLGVVLGDQLDRNSSLFRQLAPDQDAVWMAEAAEESTAPRSHKMRIAVFLSAMRHFRDELRDRGLTVHYKTLDAGATSLAAALLADLKALRPARVCLVETGDYRIEQALLAACETAGVPCEVLVDTHFYCSRSEFGKWLNGRKQPRMENFYREMRRRHNVLMEGDEPTGGKWNFDHDNRKSFGRAGPGLVPPPPHFAPDGITQEVIALVQAQFPDHPGELDDFNWPVTPDQARLALADFVRHRLQDFGRYQDAMWTGQPFLNHSLLSVALNLKLINPREVVDTVVAEGLAQGAPLASVEGFVRQVLGWREYVRGLYWARMPGYLTENALDASLPLPAFYWTAETHMTCLAESIGQTLRFGYAHHIQRLMVTGLFALLAGVRPAAVHEWYLGIYVDAVEWVELPNTLGMSQFADGGVMASKPYVASGKYIERMSNYCQHCRFDPGTRIGPDACPFTVLFWDFLMRHEARFGRHPRTSLMWRNLARVPPEEQAEIAALGQVLKEKIARGEPI